jgi:hypothetical protein
MSTPLRVLAFVSALAAAFALAWGGGRLVGPESGDLFASASEPTGHRVERLNGNPGTPSGMVAEATGLTARADGFTLALADRTPDAGRTRLDFQVLTSSGRPLLDYTREHEKDLHLIVVRRDLTGFQHVHPRLDRSTGTWSVDVRLTPGVWRVVADLVPEGWEGITLADDVSVAGDFTPAALPVDDRVAEVETDAGTYTVTLEGDTAPGASTVLTTRIELDGEPVTDLEPYLGAHGHLVAMRAGDLGYLHVHPEEGPAGPGIDFATAFPEPAPSRLSRHSHPRAPGHTGAYTVEGAGPPAPDSGDDSGHAEGGDHDH